MHNLLKLSLSVLMLVTALPAMAKHGIRHKHFHADSIIFKPVKGNYLLNTKPVSTPKHRPDTSHKPALAFKRSGFIPGWGQLYNGKWWKTPVIYTGLGLFGYSILYNHQYYSQYLAVYRYFKQDPATVNAKLPHYTLYRQFRDRSYTAPAVANYVNGYQRNLQLSILGFAGLWGLQMIDAYIDAKFIHSYSMDRELSFKISPGIIKTSSYASGASPVAPALKLIVKL